MLCRAVPPLSRWSRPSPATPRVRPRTGNLVCAAIFEQTRAQVLRHQVLGQGKKKGEGLFRYCIVVGSWRDRHGDAVLRGGDQVDRVVANSKSRHYAEVGTRTDDLA